MKKLILLLSFVFYLFALYAQNVGINNISPTEKLSINGNLLVSQPVTRAKGLPDAAHTSSMAANRIDSILIIKDSVYRLYDPGGTGNYPANNQSGIQIADTAGYASGQIPGGFELSFDSINIASGDSIYLVNKFTNEIFYRAGNNINGTHPVFSGNDLELYLVSAASSPGAPGFSAVIRKLVVNKSDAGSGGNANTGTVSLFFNSLTGAFRSGIANSNTLGNAAFEIGNNCSASGNEAGAIGYGSVATGENDLGICGGSASGGNSVAIGRSTFSVGNYSLAMGAGSNANGSYSTAIGGAAAMGANSMAAGAGSISNGVNSMALAGGHVSSTGPYAIAIGSAAKAEKDYSIAIGSQSDAGENSTAIGYSSNANDNAAALGVNAHANGVSSVALGDGASATGASSVATTSSAAYGSYSIAIGKNSSANGLQSIAAGSSCITGVNGNNSIAIGTSASALAANAIAIGNNVTADGVRSTAMGNYCSTSGFTGSFTIGDNSTTTVMQTFEDNAFRARFAKGFRFYTTNAVTIGAYLNQGANSWAALSDKRMKENFVPVDGETFLRNIAAMPLTTWNYKGQDVKTFRHYGPMAQDFFAAFGKDKLGVIGCDTLINQQDFLGVNLIAIQALEKRTTDLKKENDLLKDQNLIFRKENEQLEARLRKLENIVLKE